MASKFGLGRKRRKRGVFPFRNVVTRLTTPLSKVATRLTTPLRKAVRLVLFTTLTRLAKGRISRILPKRRKRGGGGFRRILGR